MIPEEMKYNLHNGDKETFYGHHAAQTPAAVSFCLFVHVLTFTLVSSLLFSLKCLFYLAQLNKDDNSHSSGACFHILVSRSDINFSEVLFILSVLS